MTRPPFGLGSGGEGGEEPPENPFGALFGGAGLPGMSNPGDLAGTLHRFADLLSWSGGPVNWDLARQAAQQVVGAVGDPGTGAADERSVADAVRLADLWLDPVSTLPSGVTATEAWSRRRWVEATLPVWRTLVEPVAGQVVAAMGPALGGALPAGLPPEAAAMLGPLGGMMAQIGGVMFGAQIGQALGQLATEVVGSTDVGLPLGPAGRAALLPANVAAFGAGLEVDPDEVRLYLALREAAHHRLFGHVPWLRPRLIEAVESFARGIHVDTEAIATAMGQLDPGDPESLQRALGGGMLEPPTTDEQRAALGRLETLLALVEGWVDAVVTAAAAGQLPGAERLRETTRRRRATGGPAEQAFGALVGLELRPRRLREAAALWQRLAEERGVAGRDAVWAHPDLLPTGDDLDDPAGFVRRTGAESLDLGDLEAAPDAGDPDEDRDDPSEPGAGGDDPAAG